jgi:hypothetical protein
MGAALNSRLPHALNQNHSCARFLKTWLLLEPPEMFLYSQNVKMQLVQRNAPKTYVFTILFVHESAVRTGTENSTTKI